MTKPYIRKGNLRPSIKKYSSLGTDKMYDCIKNPTTENKKATQILTGYGPKIAKVFFDGDKSKYELWEVKFLGYLRIQQLHQIKLSSTNQSDDMDFVEKNATVFAELIQYLDDKSLSLVIRDTKHCKVLVCKFKQICV